MCGGIGTLLAAAGASKLLAIGLFVAGVTASIYFRFRTRRLFRHSIQDLGDRVDAFGRTAFVRRSGRAREPASPPADHEYPRDLDWIGRRLELRAAALTPRLEELILTRASQRAIIDGIDTPVFATDETGLVRLVNRAGERLFHRRSGKLSGVDLEELFPQQTLLDLHDLAQRGEACRGEIRLTIGEAVRVYEVTSSPVRLDILDIPAASKQRAGVVLTLRDITELAKIIQLRSDFVANASHELRTPIAAIRGALETIRGPASNDESMRERLFAMIESNSHRLEEMVSDLLDLSNLEGETSPITPRPVETSEVCDALRHLFNSVCETRGLTLEFEIDSAIGHLWTDPKLLMLILRNLVDNATKYAFEGTPIRIVGELVPDGSYELAKPLDAPDDPSAQDTFLNISERTSSALRDTSAANDTAGVRFRVIDIGEGIPMKHQPRIFERFYQVSESRTRDSTKAGTGLGLSIVKNALKRLRGSIGLESVLKEGTTMTVEIPGCVLLVDEDESQPTV